MVKAHSCLVSDLRGKAFSSSPYTMMHIIVFPRCFSLGFGSYFLLLDCSVFMMNGYFIGSYAFSAPIEMITWYLYFYSINNVNYHVEFQILNPAFLG